MAELLIELFSEEIPARMQVRAAEDFKKLVTDRLDGAGLSYTSAAAHDAPRLVLVVDGLPTSSLTSVKMAGRAGRPIRLFRVFSGRRALRWSRRKARHRQRRILVRHCGEDRVCNGGRSTRSRRGSDPSCFLAEEHALGPQQLPVGSSAPSRTGDPRWGAAGRCAGSWGLGADVLRRDQGAPVPRSGTDICLQLR